MSCMSLRRNLCEDLEKFVPKSLVKVKYLPVAFLFEMFSTKDTLDESEQAKKNVLMHAGVDRD